MQTFWRNHFQITEAANCCSGCMRLVEYTQRGIFALGGEYETPKESAANITGRRNHETHFTYYINKSGVTFKSRKSFFFSSSSKIKPPFSESYSATVVISIRPSISFQSSTLYLVFISPLASNLISLSSSMIVTFLSSSRI